MSRAKSPMRQILDTPLLKCQAALWFLGQSGYVLRAANACVVIDPYLSDSAAKVAPELARVYPVPIAPADLNVDLFIITHDHLDHLDPETIAGYRHRKTTTFVAPRLACRKLLSLGVPQRRIRRVDSGDTETIGDVRITGAYALPSEPNVIDTTGYHLRFANGRSFYHSSDTGFSQVQLDAAPRGVEVLAVCINGKWGNLGPDGAARLAERVKPRYAIPNHYDLMPINQENPQTFAYLLRERAPDVACKILEVMQSFIWSERDQSERD